MIKLIHLADLHIGKRLNEMSLIEDQEYILKQILSIIDEEKPDGVMIAGDVYDSPMPSTEAVALLDDFVVKLSKRVGNTFIISGNHDAEQRLSFGGRLMAQAGVHIAPVYDGTLTKVEIPDKDSQGTKAAVVHMLPFVKPQNVRRFFPEREIKTYTEAVTAALSVAERDGEKANVLITHQYVTEGILSDSEMPSSVGGSDNVDSCAFEGFDYVALGHLHRPQSVKLEGGIARYAGTPLKYSFSEVNYGKSVAVIEIDGRRLETRTVELKPLREMREIRGRYDDLMLPQSYENTNTDDFMRVILTDEDDVVNALGNLRKIYPNILKLEYDNARTRENRDVLAEEYISDRSPMALFSDFYKMMNNADMSPEQGEYIEKLINDVWGGEI